MAAAGYWEKCPKCGAIGKIDADQAEGRTSIICSECEHHYYRGSETGNK